MKKLTVVFILCFLCSYSVYAEEVNCETLLATPVDNNNPVPGAIDYLSCLDEVDKRAMCALENHDLGQEPNKDQVVDFLANIIGGHTNVTAQCYTMFPDGANKVYDTDCTVAIFQEKLLPIHVAIFSNKEIQPDEKRTQHKLGFAYTPVYFSECLRPKV